LHAAIHDPAGGFIKIYDSRFTASIPQGESAGRGRINLGFAPSDRTIGTRERGYLDLAGRHFQALNTAQFNAVAAAPKQLSAWEV
jgi:hypothetical protein